MFCRFCVVWFIWGISSNDRWAVFGDCREPVLYGARGSEEELRAGGWYMELGCHPLYTALWGSSVLGRYLVLVFMGFCSCSVLFLTNMLLQLLCYVWFMFHEKRGRFYFVQRRSKVLHKRFFVGWLISRGIPGREYPMVRRVLFGRCWSLIRGDGWLLNRCLVSWFALYDLYPVTVLFMVRFEIYAVRINFSLSWHHNFVFMSIYLHSLKDRCIESIWLDEMRMASFISQPL